LALPTLFLVVVLLAMFYALDTALLRHDTPSAALPARKSPLSIEGLPNFLLLAAVIGAVLLSGLWEPGVSFAIAGATIDLENALRSLLLVLLGCTSLAITPVAVRVHNQFHWAP